MFQWHLLRNLLDVVMAVVAVMAFLVTCYQIGHYAALSQHTEHLVELHLGDWADSCILGLYRNTGVFKFSKAVYTTNIE
ncbi:hypothetical protein N7454_002673 [Penicillium verhagenii]|nr:hypothetical protein N7454_002673 [Penicillium verhagenii]